MLVGRREGLKLVCRPAPEASSADAAGCRQEGRLSSDKGPLS